jgi:outer membrane protein insertion porin family
LKRVGTNIVLSKALSLLLLSAVGAQSVFAADAVTPPSISAANPAPAAPAPTVNGPLTEIRIVGNTNISAEAIRAVLQQKIGAPFDTAKAEQDRQAIYAMGYFSVVASSAEPGDKPGDVREIYTVTEYAKISGIVFKGNTAFKSSYLQSLMSTKAGEVLNANKLDQDIINIVNAYKDQGYRASVSEDVDVDKKTNALVVPIIEARITAVYVTGNKKTKKKVILREMRQKPGALFNYKVLRDDLRRIMNTNLFSNIDGVQIVTPTPGAVELTVPVEEQRSGNVSVGIGYSSSEKLVGRAEYSESNFRGLGETIALMWEVGGAQSTSSVDLSFSDPYIDKSHTGLNVDLFDKVVYRFTNSFLANSINGTNDQYLERHIGASVGLSRPVDTNTTVSVSARTEKVNSNDVALPLSEEYIRQDASISGLGLRVVNNTRDYNLNPATGGYYSASLEGIVFKATSVNNAPSPLIPSWQTSPKLGLDLRQYFSLQGKRSIDKLNEPKRVIAIRFMAGVTKTSTPFSEQYFLGGADNLRGYDEDRYWGAYMAMMNAELRIPVGNSLTGVLFTDMGDAWGSLYQGTDLEQHNSFMLQKSVGLGIRVQTPIGPVRLDWGIRSGGSRAEFGIGQAF